jgi:signal transduction histidine kinase
VTVNAAGIWGIATARRGVREESARLFRSQTEARARLLESGLAAVRTDLAFMAGSSSIARLGQAETARRSEEREWSLMATEAALLVFLRGHPEVKHVAVLAGKDIALVEAGRRGGIPVLWRTSQGGSEAETATAESGPEREIRAVFAHEGGVDGGAAPRLVATIDARVLLESRGSGPEPLGCRLSDGAGRSLVPVARAESHAAAVEWLSAEVPVRAEGWSAPSPWTLSCTQRTDVAASLEPVAARGRRALALNLIVMTLTVLLGFFAVQQARHRERAEAYAREEQRVRELERQLFHAERLGTIGRLAAGLAHEINNPLEGMANYVALARVHLDAGDAAAARADLDLVREGLDRVAGIVRQVLAQANRTDTPEGPVELSAILRQTAEFVRSRPEFRAVEFLLDLPAEPVVVHGRSVMLGQVFLNLLRNACEAQPQGGQVQVKAARDGTNVTVEIADRGAGVPAAERERIFQPFYSTKSSTGLGLSVCDAIVRQHHGRIEVDDREGGGAVFRLSLPAEAQPA